MNNKAHAFNTGAIPKKDYRNFKVSEVELFLAKDDAFPPIYKPDLSDFPIFYQGKIGSCVGHAGAWIKMFIDKEDTGEVNDYSPRFLYSLCKANDGIPNEEGTYPVMVCKMLQKYGVCTQENLPNKVTISHDEYKDIKNLTLLANEEAEDAKIKAYAEITDKSFNNLKKEIYRNGAILLCIRHGGEFYTAGGKVTWDKRKLFPLKKIDPIVSGHEVVAYGYDENYIYFVNSFGETWGDKGIGWFGADYVDRVKEAHLIVDIPNALIAELKEKRKTIQYKIIALLTELVDMIKNRK